MNSNDHIWHIGLTEMSSDTRYKIQNFIQTRYCNVTNNISYKVINVYDDE